MATWDDVARLALELPETAETVSRGSRHWRVKDKNFVWERPLNASDLRVLGDRAPEGEILGIRTDGLDAKEAMLAAEPERYFTIPHFDGYPAVLALLEPLTVDDLCEIVVEAWVARAPTRVRDAFLEARAR